MSWGLTWEEGKRGIGSSQYQMFCPSLENCFGSPGAGKEVLGVKCSLAFQHAATHSQSRISISFRPPPPQKPAFRTCLPHAIRTLNSTALRPCALCKCAVLTLPLCYSWASRCCNGRSRGAASWAARLSLTAYAYIEALYLQWRCRPRPLLEGARVGALDLANTTLGSKDWGTCKQSTARRPLGN